MMVPCSTGSGHRRSTKAILLKSSGSGFDDTLALGPISILAVVLGYTYTGTSRQSLKAHLKREAWIIRWTRARRCCA